MVPTSNSSSQATVDPWDQQPATNPIPRGHPPTPTIVRDDWEDDDDDENDQTKGAETPNTSSPDPNDTSPPGVEDNRKIWEAANTKVAAPMPTLLSSRTSSVVPPPAAAFQPTLRILKRPQGSTSPQGNLTTQSPPPGGSLQERETRYAAARERIFQSEGEEDGNKLQANGPKSGGNSPLHQSNSRNVKILREPNAPEPSGKQGQSAGFKGRNAKAAPSSLPL